jgi:hypothetical protein
MAAYRFFKNDAVSFAQVLAPHRRATVERIGQSPVVLLAQDTSELDYRSQTGIQGLGPPRMPQGYGAHLHPLLALTAEGLCLGVVEAKLWCRSETKEETPPLAPKNRPIEEKESFRGLERYRHACSLANDVPPTCLIVIGDRESDRYELFLERHQQTSPCAEWLVRCAQDRSLLEQEPETAKWWSRLRASPVLGEIEFEIPATAHRAARKVRQTLRARQVTLKPPYRQGQSLPPVAVYAVLATEIDPPTDVDPLEWFLLTSLPIPHFEEAVTLMGYYLKRWQIEVFFHVLKNGCKVEALQLSDFERLSPCLAFYMIIAWRVLFATQIGRTCPDLPCDLLFDTQEWQAVYLVVRRKAPPSKPPSLTDMIQMVASLGGHLGRKHDGPPGPKTLWIGLQRARDFVIALEALRSTAPPTCV